MRDQSAVRDPDGADAWHSGDTAYSSSPGHDLIPIGEWRARELCSNQEGAKLPARTLSSQRWALAALSRGALLRTAVAAAAA